MTINIIIITTFIPGGQLERCLEIFANGYFVEIVGLMGAFFEGGGTVTEVKVDMVLMLSSIVHLNIINCLLSIILTMIVIIIFVDITNNHQYHNYRDRNHHHQIIITIIICAIVIILTIYYNIIIIITMIIFTQILYIIGLG